MAITKTIQREVAAYIADTYGQKPFEWRSPNHFQDYHGFDGYIFKSEQAARRYVLRWIDEYGSECENAASKDTWIDVLAGIGMTLRGATNLVKRGNWTGVARRMLNACGAAYFLATYGGKVEELSNGSLLYY